MDEKNQKEKDARKWRIGLVSADYSPAVALDPRLFPDKQLADVAGVAAAAAPEGCVVVAFQSRSKSFDERCAALAALASVNIGKGDFTFFDFVRFYGLQHRLTESARTCIDLRGKLERTERRVGVGVAAGLAIGALLGGLAVFFGFT